jgi:cholesterol transport system auxiliary component
MTRVARTTTKMTMRQWPVHGAVLGLLVLLQQGCTSGLLESNVPAPETYRLGLGAAAVAGPADAGATTAAPTPYALTVTRPRAASSLDTDRIAVVPAGSRFDYYSDVRWADSAPEMLQHNLVAALVASGRFTGVVAAPARVPAELLLDVELRHFEAVAASEGAAPAVYVQLQANLVDSRRAVRVASFVSEARVPAAQNRRAAIVAAFERASAQVVDDVVARVGAAASGLAPQTN